MKSIKVTVYVRQHGTRKYKRAKPNVKFPAGTCYVLRYAGKWETLPEGTTWAQARVAVLAKQASFLEGAEVPAPTPKPKKATNALLKRHSTAISQRLRRSRVTRHS